MKKILKIITACLVAFAMLFSTYHIQPQQQVKEHKKSTLITLNKQTAEAKGFFPFKPKPKPKPKKKKKTTAQLYSSAKKKGTKVKGRHTTYQKSKKLRSLPKEVKKNYSSRDFYKDGKLSIRRYYGKTGKADMDIHYTNHGNEKSHPKVPHRHNWHYKNGKLAPGDGY
ncbi:hypothetical protein [Rummeliibacillus stabekisii]|uniref:Uncharacterized protein n=1 Tax=Rummeliibacillus stabekisii TaxID=241244 RepID=A0A143HCZ3_9BACL|nr:hypothetical protein [Rummeliibacillus stabekisii]AMW99365.1 hypothetical protein ATY39_07730 [Rummeliibacillus stabekisii]